MADTSGSGGSIGFTFEDTQRIAEGITQVHAATEKANSSAGSFKDTMHETAAALAEMDASALKDQATAIAEQAGAMAKNFGLSKTETKKLKDNLIGMLTIETALLKARKEGAAVAKAQGVAAKTLEATGAQIAKGWKKWTGGVSTLGVAKQISGLDVSLGGLIASIIEAVNQGRKIQGLAAIAAGPLGGAFEKGTRAIDQTRAAMGDLRGQFGMTYEEAAEVVTQLTRMGFAGDKLAGKSFVPKDIRGTSAAVNVEIAKWKDYDAEAAKKLTPGAKVSGKIMRAMIPDHTKRFAAGDQAKRDEKSAALDREAAAVEINRLTGVRAEKERQVAAENEKARRSFAGTVGYAREMAAIQTVYGIAVSKSGSIIKDLQLEYRATEEEARGMLGAALQTSTELQNTGVKIGAGELLEDWTQLLAKTRAYKTDLLGVLGLYNTLMRKDKIGKDKFGKDIFEERAAKFGMGGMSKSVKMGMLNAIAGMPSQMEIGWQARMGKETPEGGGSPVARAMEFRDLFQTSEGTAEALKRVLTEVKGMGEGSGEAETRYRTELLLTKVGFPKEAAMDMAKRMATGEITDEKIAELAKEQVIAAKEAEKLQKGWPKARESLVNYAGDASRAMKSVQELIKQWLTDKLLTILVDIRDIIDTIAASVWVRDPGAQKRVAARKESAQYMKDLDLRVPLTATAIKDLAAEESSYTAAERAAYQANDPSFNPANPMAVMKRLELMGPGQGWGDVFKSFLASDFAGNPAGAYREVIRIINERKAEKLTDNNASTARKIRGTGGGATDLTP